MMNHDSPPKNETHSHFFRKIDRRTLLKALGVVGLGAIAGGVIQAVFHVVKIGSGLHRVSLTRIAMGTFVTITAVHESKDQAQEAIGRTFEEIERLIAIFSRHDPATPLSMLNQQGGLTGPPPELVDLLQRSFYFHRLSGRAFDITVKPLVDLIKEKAEHNGPSSAEIESVLALVDMNKVFVGTSHLTFRDAGMGITLDGIAKGYIVDRASRVLESHGIENHLINAGGDIRTRGMRSEKKPWTVAIEDPKKKKHYPDVIEMTTGAVATSGSYEVYFGRDKVFHHIVDPRSGWSPGHHVSVSVRAQSVMQADALSTAIFVLKPAAGLRLINSLDHSECLLIDGAGIQIRSTGWVRSAV
jgi:thiamine biosynthesis lipoprotein